MLTVADLLDLNDTIAADLFAGKTYPWEALEEIGDYIRRLGPTLSLSLIHIYRRRRETECE